MILNFQILFFINYNIFQFIIFSSWSWRRFNNKSAKNKQRQMQVLASRQATTVRTRELYQEQYKLGTRSLVDLLNAEQAIHSANSELESARYDIYNSIVQYIAATGRSRQAYGLNNISIQGFEVQP